MAYQGNAAWARRPAPPRRRSRLTLVLGSIAIVLLVASAGLAGAVLLYSRDIITPGLQSFGVDLGGYSRAGAEAALRASWERQAVTVDLGGMTQTVRPEDLGVTLDVTATVSMAYEAGRSSAAIDQMLHDRRLAVPQTGIEPIWRFDPARADRTLQTLARQVYMPPVDAGVKIDAAHAVATAATPGRALSVGASGARLGADPWGTVTSGRFQPVIVPVSPAITDTTAVVSAINRVLSTPVSIHLYDAIGDEKRDWQIAPADMAGWVALTPAAGGAQVAWSFDPARAEATLTAQAAALGADRYLDMPKLVPAVLDAAKAPGGKVSARIYHKGRQYTVKPGDTLSAVADQVGIPYPWIQKANPGLGDAIRAGQVIEIPSQDVMIPLPPVENKRLVVSIGQQRVWAYENGKVKWDWPASTGMSFSPTAPGFFQIQNHEPNAYAGNWTLWMPWFMGVYRPVPDVDFMNGFHGFPSRQGSQILWTNDLGHPITYGCILLSTENEKMLYDWAPEGVVVEIRKQ